MKKYVKKNLPFCIYLWIHFIALMLIFLFVRQTFHSDEVWSYNIANDSVASSIFKDNDGKSINIGTWTSAEVLHNAVTVQKDERFHFEIPYRNAVADYHPPLTFFMIHFVSSFAPDTFSWWFFIPFNILAMLLCDIYLYRVLKLYKIPWVYSLFLCAIMDFSNVGIAMTVYLRMYTLLAAFGLMILYYSLKIFETKKISKKEVIGLFIVNVLGGMTCYEYFVFAFFVAAFICIFLLIKKAWKLFLQYGLSMLGGVGIALVLFPEAIKDMFLNSGGEGFSSWENYPYFLQLKMLVYMMLQNVFGIYKNPFEPFFLGMVPKLLVIVYVLFIVTPIAYVCRDTAIVKKLIQIVKTLLNNFVVELKERGSLLFLCITSFFAFLLVMNNSISVYEMADQSLRYMFILEPVMVLFVGCLLYGFAKLFIKDMKVTVPICGMLISIMLFLSLVTGSDLFIRNGEKSSGAQISEVKNSQIVLVVLSPAALERVTSEIDSSNQFLVVTYEDLKNYEKVLKEADPTQPMHLIIEENVYGKNVEADSYKNMTEATSLENMNSDKTDLYEDVKKEKTNEIQDYLKSLGIAEEFKYLGTMRMLNEGFDLIELN